MKRNYFWNTDFKYFRLTNFKWYGVTKYRKVLSISQQKYLSTWLPNMPNISWLHCKINHTVNDLINYGQSYMPSTFVGRKYLEWLRFSTTSPEHESIIKVWFSSDRGPIKNKRWFEVWTETDLSMNLQRDTLNLDLLCKWTWLV